MREQFQVSEIDAAQAIVDKVKKAMEAIVCRGRQLAPELSIDDLVAGKLLRTRFAARLSLAADYRQTGNIIGACVAVELVHSASLLHDDIIDGAAIRRSRPVVWKTIGPNAAVLLGDLLYCEALSEILKGENARQCSRLVDKVKEVCAAEMDQELHLRSNALSQPQCVAIARRKTGPLFAFLGFVCGGNDAPLSEALEEAGYLTGAAYQLADDMLDAVGSEEVAGKTLHTDELRQKYTVAREAGDNGVEAAGLVWNMLKSALALLSPWPLYQKGLSDFLVQDLQPVLDSYLIPIDIKAQLAA